MPLPDIDPAAVPLELVAPVALPEEAPAAPPEPAACAENDDPQTANAVATSIVVSFMGLLSIGKVTTVLSASSFLSL